MAYQALLSPHSDPVVDTRSPQCLLGPILSQSLDLALVIRIQRYHLPQATRTQPCV